MGLFDFLGGGQAQMPGQAQQPGFMQKLLAPEVALPMAAALMGGQGNAANLGNAFAAGGQGMAQQKQLQAQTAEKNRTLDFFRQQAPEYAQMIDAGMPINDAFKLYTEQRHAKTADPYKVVGGQIFDTRDQSFMAPPAGSGPPETGLSPVMLRNKDGVTIYAQPTKDGRLLASQVPDGFEPYDPHSKAYATASGTEAGKTQAAAAAALPGAAGLADQVSAQVESLKSDPHLHRMLGPIDSRLPTITADGARVQGKIDQLKGGAFLQARQLLKGGGAITDFEGQKAEAAFVRMNQAQSVEDFNAALDEFNSAVQAGVAKLQAQAGGGQPSQGGGNRTQSGVSWSVEP